MSKMWKIIVFSLGICIFLPALLAPRYYLINYRESPSKAAVKGLEIAIKGYETEYLNLPQVAANDTTTTETRGPLLAMLLAEDSTANPRQIRFFDPPPLEANKNGVVKNAAGEWELRDPWGNFYHVQLDVDGNDIIPNPAHNKDEGEAEALTTDVLIYSAGPDGDFTTWKDNVCSWK